MSTSGTIIVSASIEVEAPASRAWSVVSDYSYDAQWREGVESMTQDVVGSVVDDTTTVEDYRILGQRMLNTAVIPDVVAGRSFRWSMVSGTVAEGTREVLPLGADRSEIRLETRSRPSGAMESLLRPLIKPVLTRSLRRSLVELKRIVEG
jgi:hypothetical protein